MNFNNLIKNGLYLPFLSFFIYFLTDDLYLTTFFFLKAFSVNYYVNYCHLYSNPKIYRWRHMIRLTDTGHIASFLFYFNKKTIPIAHNIHFVINSGYYISKLLFNMKDTDKVDRSYYINEYIQKFHEYLNHSISYILIVYYMLTNSNENYEFDNMSLLYTYIWLYVWLLFIYTPWVLLTDDYIYSIFEPSKPIYIRLGMILFINILAYISNNVGKIIQLYQLFIELIKL